MASDRAETGLRITDGLLVLLLALATLVTTWLPQTELLLRIALGFMAALALLFGTVVLIGRTKAGPLVRTRRRWKYVSLFVYLALVVIMIIVNLAMTSGQFSGSAPWGLLSGLLALFLVQLYERGGAPRQSASSLNDRNAGAYRRLSLLALFGGITLGTLGISGATAGNPALLAQLLPPAVFCLVFAAGIWVMLRTRKQQ